MLEKHLIAKTNPHADAHNILRWKKYRVTVLQDRLFRLERSENEIFRDDATLAVWFRNMPPQQFAVKEKAGRLILDTGACRLSLAENREDCRIVINGRTRKIENGSGNLLGTYRTLDCCDGDMKHWWNDLNKERGKITLGFGVCSKTGVAVFDDAASITLGEDGMPKPIHGDGSDEYIFAYGNAFREAVKALYLITGYPPMLPRFALGNWWSRYHDYSDREYLRLLNTFEEHDVPLTVATLDMDWHYSGADEITDVFHLTEQEFADRDRYIGVSCGWTGYTWNERLFPDHKKFLDAISEKNLKITLNLHPADGVRRWEAAYPAMAAAMGGDAASGERIPFDIASEDFIGAYFKILHEPHEKEGVSFWWIDWQQGALSGMEGLDPLWALNHYHYLDNAKNHAVPLILSRYAGIGSHRYPLGFSGDTFITWKSLKYLPYFTLTASNIGYTWWSHDIAGHNMGEMDRELYVRGIQYGVFSPINRLHSSDVETLTKEPWAYGNGAGRIAAEFMRFRHKMIPFLYTASYRTHREGLALIEPLYYLWDVPSAYRKKEEYLFAEELIVAPVVKKSEKDGFARVDAWLPAGHFTDIFTGDEYEIGDGGREITFYRDLESIPVLARAGAVIPLSMDGGNSAANPKNLEIWAYNGDRTYSLYEDGGEMGGEAFFTDFEMRYEEKDGICVQTLIISSRGDGAVIPADRTMLIRFRNIKEGTFSLWIGGQKSEVREYLTDCAAIRLAFAAGQQYRIEVSFRKPDPVAALVLRAREVLTRAEGGTNAKRFAWRKIREAKTMEAYVELVDAADISEIAKLWLKETL